MISDFDQTCNNLCSHSVLLILIAKDFIFRSILFPIIFSPILFRSLSSQNPSQTFWPVCTASPAPITSISSSSAAGLRRLQFRFSPLVKPKDMLYQCPMYFFCRHSEIDSPTVAATLFSKTEFFVHFLSLKQMRWLRGQLVTVDPPPHRYYMKQ